MTLLDLLREWLVPAEFRAESEVDESRAERVRRTVERAEQAADRLLALTEEARFLAQGRRSDTGGCSDG